MQLTKATLLDHRATKEYQFIWEQKINGVVTPNRVIISMNPNSGKIRSYIGISRDIEVSLVPAITQQNALEIAMNQFPSIEPVRTDAILSIDYPKKDEQKLLWIVTIEGKSRNGMKYGGIVAIDAQSGYVYAVDSYA